MSAQPHPRLTPEEYLELDRASEVRLQRRAVRVGESVIFLVALAEMGAGIQIRVLRDNESYGRLQAQVEKRAWHPDQLVFRLRRARLDAGKPPPASSAAPPRRRRRRTPRPRGASRSSTRSICRRPRPLKCRARSRAS